MILREQCFISRVTQPDGLQGSVCLLTGVTAHNRMQSSLG